MRVVGHPVMPINLGGLTITSLGKVNFALVCSKLCHMHMAVDIYARLC